MTKPVCILMRARGAGLLMRALSAGLIALALSPVLAAAQQNAPPASTEPPPTLEKQCIKDVSGFITKGKSITFVAELENTCDFKLKCVVNAYVISAFGARQGHKTLILAAKSDGPRAKQSMRMAVKSDSGGTYRTHKCTQV